MNFNKKLLNASYVKQNRDDTLFVKREIKVFIDCKKLVSDRDRRRELQKDHQI